MDRANLPPGGAITQERFVMGLAKSQPTQVVGHAVQIRELQRVYAIDNKRVNMFLAIGRRRFAAAARCRRRVGRRGARALDRRSRLQRARDARDPRRGVRGGVGAARRRVGADLRRRRLDGRLVQGDRGDPRS